ncbi:MAG: heparinase II/III-family protein, partial [bacterium]
MDLPHTGWHLLRPGAGWELAFKCGVPCPPHLGAHAHSDLLSLDLWHQGRPVIAEVGTSVYGTGPDRQFERSSPAHNSLQLGMSRHGSIQWVEPVEVWAGFRAGRKAQPLARRQGRQGP